MDNGTEYWLIYFPVTTASSEHTECKIKSFQAKIINSGNFPDYGIIKYTEKYTEKQDTSE